MTAPTLAAGVPVRIGCGCTGVVHHAGGGPWPAVAVLVQHPCGRCPNTAGVIHHARPNDITQEG